MSAHDTLPVSFPALPPVSTRCPETGSDLLPSPTAWGATAVLSDEAARPEFAALLKTLQSQLSQWKSDPTALETHFREQLSSLIRFAADESAYYRQRIQPTTPDSAPIAALLESLPVLRKTDIQQHFVDLWCDAFSDDETLKHWKTSGSTGEPTRFIVDAFSALSREIAFWLTQNLVHPRFVLDQAFGREPGQPVMLRLSSYEAGAPWYKPFPWLNHATLWKMSALDHPDCDLNLPIRFLKEYQPPLLGGDPQALLSLVNAWETHYPEERTFPYPLETLTCGGDQLLPEVRARLEGFFRIPITNTYALSEVGIVASECTFGRMHVQSPFNIVEVVDGQGNPVGEGELGEIVITNLMNWAFPFIRYQSGDRGRLETTKRCPCGCIFPILSDLQGRKRQHFVNAQHQPIAPQPLAAPLVQQGILQYQWVQTGLNTLHLNYRAHEPLAEATLAELKQLAAQLFGNSVGLTHQRHDALHTPGRKFQTFICQVNSGQEMPSLCETTLNGIKR